MTSLDARRIFADLTAENGKPLRDCTTTELETLKFYLGAILVDVENVLTERYNEPPIDMARDEETADTCPHGNRVWFGHECGECESEQ